MKIARRKNTRPLVFRFTRSNFLIGNVTNAAQLKPGPQRSIIPPREQQGGTAAHSPHTPQAGKAPAEESWHGLGLSWKLSSGLNGPVLQEIRTPPQGAGIFRSVKYEYVYFVYFVDYFKQPYIICALYVLGRQQHHRRCKLPGIYVAAALPPNAPRAR